MPAGERLEDDVGHHAPDALGRRPAQHLDARRRQVLVPQQSRPHRIVDVVIHVGDDVGDARDLPLDRAGAMLGIGADRHAALPLRVAGDAVADLPRQIQPRAVVLEDVDDAQALLVVVEAAGNELVDDALAGMTERRVAEIVAERDRLGQLLVEPQHLGDAARDLRDLERVRQPRAVVIAGRREEHLRLVLQPAERLAVDDAIAIALKRRTDRVLGLGTQPAAAVGALGRLRRQDLALALLELLADAVMARRPGHLAHHQDIARGSSCRAPAARRRTARRASARDRRTSAHARDRRSARTAAPTANTGTCSRE